jgi:hypothetical protein
MIRGLGIFLGLSLIYFSWLYVTYQPIHDQWHRNFGHLTPAEFWDIGDING